jgi:hypothetical protein
MAIQHISNNKWIVWEQACDNRKAIETIFSMQSMPYLNNENRDAIMG